MKKFVPTEKLSKKEKRKLSAAKRRTWGALNPVTRKAEPPKAYNRKKVQKGVDDTSDLNLFSFPSLPLFPVGQA